MGLDEKKPSRPLRRRRAGTSLFRFGAGLLIWLGLTAIVIYAGQDIQFVRETTRMVVSVVLHSTKSAHNQPESPDLLVNALASLVTAATILGVVVTAVAAMMANQGRDEIERAIDRYEEKFTSFEERQEALRTKLASYEQLASDLAALGLEKPDAIRNSVLVSINDTLRSAYRPAEELRRDIIATIERDILDRLVGEYRSALAVLAADKRHP